MTFHLTCVHIILVLFGLLGNSCSLGILTICNFSYFPFRFKGLDLGSDFFSSWFLHTFYFHSSLFS